MAKKDSYQFSSRCGGGISFSCGLYAQRTFYFVSPPGGALRDWKVKWMWIDITVGGTQWVGKSIQLVSCACVSQLELVWDWLRRNGGIWSVFVIILVESMVGLAWCRVCLTCITLHAYTRMDGCRIKVWGEEMGCYEKMMDAEERERCCCCCCCCCLSLGVRSHVVRKESKVSNDDYEQSSRWNQYQTLKTPSTQRLV